LTHGTTDYNLHPRDNGGLGHTGSTRGVNQHAQIEAIILRSVGIWRTHRSGGEGLGLQVGREEDEGNSITQLGLDLVVDALSDVGIDNTDVCVCDLQALNKRSTSQVVVDEGGLCTEGPEGEPQEDEAVRVLKVEPNDLLGLDVVLFAQPRGIAKDTVIDLSIGVCLALEDEKIARAMAGLSILLEPVKCIYAIFALTEDKASNGFQLGFEKPKVI
jgi:hypothetical protein